MVREKREMKIIRSSKNVGGAILVVLQEIMVKMN